MADIDLNFLARQNAQILADLAEMRDNNVVVTGMLRRIEARMVALERGQAARPMMAVRMLSL